MLPMAEFGRKSLASGSHGIAITSHPLATRAAVDVLRAGGNACDAALAASSVQLVVEPHLTSLTGALSLLYREGASGKASYLNGGVNAPLARLDGFSSRDVLTGRGVPVPGFWPAFEAAQRQFGSRSIAELLALPIELAREGFAIYPFLFGEMFAHHDTLGRTEAGRSTFFHDGALLTPGATLRQPLVALTLQRLAGEGMAYYCGDFTDQFCHVVREAGGVMVREDFEKYDVRWQEPAIGTYRKYKVVGSPPPDNGGSLLIEMLNMVELIDLQRQGPPTESVDTLFDLICIHNEVYCAGASQNDPTSHPLSLATLLSKEYAEYRLQLLRMTRPISLPNAVSPGTCHVTVADEAGNIASLVHSHMSLPWGNGLFAEGFMVSCGGMFFLRTMPLPGRRVTAYMAPNIIFEDEVPVLASGAPSVSLLACVLQNTVNILDFDLSIEASVHRPRFGLPGQTNEGWRVVTRVESGFDAKLWRGLQQRSLPLEIVAPWGYHMGTFEGVQLEPAGFRACADPRRAGAAEAF